jgi:hypothetical protein
MKQKLLLNDNWPMRRLTPFLALALIVAAAGCGGRPDPVLAAFVNDEFSTNRIVLYASGKYELYGANEDGTLTRRPFVTGTYLRGVSNYIVTVEKKDLPIDGWPVKRVYRIIKHDGVEYLFDERGLELSKYEQTKDPKELRHAWRREGG